MKENDKTPISEFLNKLLPYLENAGFEPADDSPAANEIKSFKRRESIETAFSQAAQSFISATDHLEALDTLVKMERFAMAPWSSARGMIEAAAISAWLLEPDIGPTERVGRSLSLRYTTLREQKKMARYDGDRDLVQKIADRIEVVEEIAVELGFPVLRDKRGQRTGIAQAKPTMTVLAERQFKGENFYRMLSGMAHADYTSLTAFSFLKTAVERRQGALLIRAVPTEIQSALLSKAGTIYAKCAWLRIIQFGLDAAKMAVFLEGFYDELRLADTNSDRFWRTLIGRSS
jgi:hypothetical protein